MDRRSIIALALYSLNGLGSGVLQSVLTKEFDAEMLIEEGSEKISKGVRGEAFRKLQKEWRKDREGTFRRMEKYAEGMEAEGIHFTYCYDEGYPKRLLSLGDHPFGLFYIGSLPSEELPVVSVIGARECSEYGWRCAEDFGSYLGSNGVQVVSGMARGIDGISQSAAMKAGGKSFGILGCGVDICYPKENRKLYETLKIQGGILSEYLPKTEAKANLFPARNRIISGICDLLLVVEARKKSGTYITVCQALEQGREIYAVPGRITDGLSDGCNRLIIDGAGIAADPEVIMEALCFQGKFRKEGILHRSSGCMDPAKDLPKERFSEAKDLKHAILRVLEDTPKDTERIRNEVMHFGFDPSHTEILCALTELVLEGGASEIGNFYKKQGSVKP